MKYLKLKIFICFLLFFTVFTNIFSNESVYRQKAADQEMVEDLISKNQHKIQNAIISHPDQAAILKAWSINHNPYSKTQAKVRIGELYNEGELVFIRKRLEKVKQELEVLNIKGQTTPKIAVCASGGGYRAMISFAGFLSGLEKTGILKLLMYVSALSGSTWTLAPWTCKNSTLTEFKDLLRKQVPSGLTPIIEPNQVKQFNDALLDKLINLQPITPVDIYGGLLANKLLIGFDDRHAVRLSESAHFCMTGERFMPIYTSIICNNEPYRWMEYTPFEIGSSYLKSYVPTWAYGRKFNRGVSTDYAPEQSLGYLLGIFGSAFEVAMKDLILQEEDKLKQSSMLLYSILSDLDKTEIGNLRLWPATIFNFCKNIPASPLKNENYISTIDAGINFNLPMPPLLERHPDIIIVFDASAGNVGGMEFKKAYRWALENKFKMPKLDLNDNNLEKRNITILKDTDPNVPIIIYMPLANENGEYKNGYKWDLKDYTSTFNFKYSSEQFDELAGLAEFNVINNADKIFDIIQEVAQRNS